MWTGRTRFKFAMRTDRSHSSAVILTFLIFLQAYCAAIGPERPKYKTAYACEGAILNMECEPDHVINLIRANYGRFSITICNEHGNTEWSVNCMSLRSHRVLHDRCSKKQNCTIAATTRRFGDPCPGTLKYLEAHFQCVPVNPATNTARPRPPWFLATKTTVSPINKEDAFPSYDAAIEPTAKSEDEAVNRTLLTTIPTLRPPPWLITTNDSNTTTTTPPSTTTSQRTTTTLQPTTTTSMSLQPVMSPTESSLPKTFSNEIEEDIETYAPSFDPQIPVTSSSPDMRTRESWCSPTTDRNLFWNWTKGGDVAAQSCPGGASGWATRSCRPDGWMRPDLSDCRSVWLTTLQSRAAANDAVLSVAHDLTLVTESRPLYGGDMTAGARLINALIERMSHDASTFPDEAQREALITELLIKTLTTCSNLLGRQLTAWGDLESAEHHTTVTELLLGLEEAAFLLAKNLYHEKTITHISENIFMQIKVVETHNVVPLIFPLMEVERYPMENVQPITGSDYESQANNKNSSLILNNIVTLPPEAMLENSENGLVKIVFFSYEGLQRLLQPGRYFDRSYRDPNSTRIVNSRVLSASLGAGRHIELSEAVLLTFELIRKINVTNPSCVFWDFTTSMWSDEGCSVLLYNGSHVVCECDHLTNFAVLMDIMTDDAQTSQALAFTTITFIGCAVAVVCLFLTTVFFHAFHEVKGDRLAIHKNLCLCLVACELLYIAGVLNIPQPVISSIVNGFLHYFVVAIFLWMFLEGVQLFLMLADMFEIEKSRIHWYYGLAYGAPALVVAVSAIVNPYAYGLPNIGWLSLSDPFVYSLIVPASIILAANLIILSASMVRMYRHARNSAALKNKDNFRISSLRSWLHAAIIIMLLVAMTWTFALIYLNQVSLSMAYVFTVLNSIQGLFIFIFHFLQSDKKLCQSRDMDGGNLDSDQAETSQTVPTTKLPSLRLNCNMTTIQPDRFTIPTSSLEQNKRCGISNNNPPWNHTYTEIPEGMHPDPVYEEIDKERKEILLTESDDDGRRQNSDVSRQSSRNYGDHRPLLPYTLADHVPTSHPSMQVSHANFHPRYPETMHRLGQNVSMAQSVRPVCDHSMTNGIDQSPLSNTCLGIVDSNCYYPQKFNSLPQASIVHDQNWDPSRIDMQQLQNMGEMTVAVLNGEQVVCKLKSPLAPIHENSQVLQPIGAPSDRYYVHSYQRC